MKRILFLSIIVVLFAACATSGGVDFSQIAAGGKDVFAGKSWNAPRRNNMYDRWEFNTDGTFHFVHVHHGKPIDRGIYLYEAHNGTINIVKESEEHKSVYTYEFKGKTFTLTPIRSEGGEHHHAGGMGALPEDTVIFTLAK